MTLRLTPLRSVAFSSPPAVQRGGMKFHILDGLPKSVSPSSHATEADGFVFLTGQFGRDLDDPAKRLPDGIRAQTEQTLSNMRRVLEALGLSMGRVMSVRVFL